MTMTQDESRLDLELLDEMAGLGIGDLRELLEVYLSQATEMMQQLAKAINADNANDVAQYAHRLAGSSAACGAATAMNLLRSMERHGREANWPAIQQEFAQTIEELKLSEHCLREYMATRNQSLGVSFVPPKTADDLHS
jgi:HPt (histidine-containing phosphotransfer) domain-containing protein